MGFLPFSFSVYRYCLASLALLLSIFYLLTWSFGIGSESKLKAWADVHMLGNPLTKALCGLTIALLAMGAISLHMNAAGGVMLLNGCAIVSASALALVALLMSREANWIKPSGRQPRPADD